MRYTDNGCYYSVSVSRADVEAFKQRWPCSGLPDKAVWFQFAKSNGDLVDVQPDGIDGEALLALSEDAKAYGWPRAHTSPNNPTARGEG